MTLTKEDANKYSKAEWEVTKKDEIDLIWFGFN